VTAELLAGHDGYRAVQELPGIGPVPVAVGGIGDITRFRHPARLCSQSGLTPRHYESDIILSFHVSRACDLRRPVVDSVADGTAAA
jgi:transposase